MSEQLQYLQTMVRGIADTFQAHPNVKAIASVGSVALGQVDDISDTDTIIYVDTLPPEEEFIALRDQVMDEWGNWYWRDPEYGYGCYVFINGVKCDFGFHPISHWEDIMTDVLVDCDLDASKQKAMSGIVNAVPLYGDDLVNQWKNRARDEYPDALAEKLVTEYLKFRPLWIVRDMAAARGDILWYYDEVVKMQHNLLSVLVGLNHMYHPMDFKHQEFIIDQMQYKPANLSERLITALRDDPVAGAAQTGKIVEEVCDLVTQHMPQVDVEAKRKWLNTPAMRWQSQ